MVNKFIGIDIGTYNTKFTDIAVGKKTIQFGHSLVTRTPEYLVQNGRVADPAVLAQFLKQHVRRKGFHTRKALIILNDSLVVTRDIHLPVGKPKEISAMIRADASEYLPFDVSQYTLRHKLLTPAAKTPGSTNYLLTASIKTDLVMDFYSAFRMAGLKPAAVDVTINCMMKYLQRIVKPESQQTVAMVELGATTCKIVILRKGIPVFQQIIANNPRKIDVMLTTLLNMERNQAEEFKIKYGLSFLQEENEDEESKAVGPVIQNQMDLILSDVYKHLNGYCSRNGVTLDRIFLAGGTALMKGLPGYIESAFSIPCSLVCTDESVKAAKPSRRISEDGVDLNQAFPYFVCLAGAAMRGD